MAARRPFWKLHRWKSIGFCLWPPSTCIWNLKLKFQSKLDLCSGNHVVYRQTDGRTDGRTDGQTDGRTDKVNPVYPPSNFVGRGYKYDVKIAYEMDTKFKYLSFHSCCPVAIFRPTFSWVSLYNSHFWKITTKRRHVNLVAIIGTTILVTYIM